MLGADLRAPLPAGSALLRPTYNSGNRALSGKRQTRVDNLEIASLEGPWGSLRVVLDGFPAVVSAHPGEEAVIALRATRETQGDDGPITMSKREDVPLLLGGAEGGVRFVAEGAPRLVGRSRYMRATVADESWSYGATETATSHRPTRTARLIGSSMAATQLRRGPGRQNRHRPGPPPLLITLGSRRTLSRGRGAGMTGEVTTELHGVWKRYARSTGWVLRDVDLTVDAGRVVGILGGNGDGKSTLFRVVAGLTRATRGRARRPRASLSYLPERLPAGLRMTADRYLGHMAGLRGGSAVPTYERSIELLESLRLLPGPDVPIARLSKGNQQKVSLARAFGFPAALTVLDEPFSGLDRPSAEALVSLIDEARSDGRSVLISAHHPGALEHCDVLHRLRAGRSAEVTTVSVPGPASHEPRPGVSRAEAGRVARLVLRAVEARAEPAWLAGLTGVRSVDNDPVRGQVVVVTSDPDALLVSALAAGSSFVHGDTRQATAETE